MKEAIKNILRKRGCCHEWEFERSVRTVWDIGDVTYKYLYICKKCGKMKWVKA